MTEPTLEDGRNIDVNGASLYVEESGQGVPVVLVHGATGTAAMYRATIALLAKEFRVVAFDSRGHGRSTNPTGELSYEITADDAAALVGALELDRPFVGGWSDGGQVALEFGLRHPGSARGLLVGAAYTDFQSEAPRSMVRTLFHGNERGLIDFDGWELAAPGFVNYLKTAHSASPDHWRNIAQQTLTMCLEYSGLSKEQIESIQTPALVIQGDRDDLVPMAEAVNLHRWLPNSEFAVLPGTNHMRPIMDPAPLATVMMDFMRRNL